MILVILGISIILITVGIILKKKFDQDWGGIDWPISIILFLVGVAAFVISTIATLVLMNEVQSAKHIDEKIEVYEQENIKIESQIDSVVTAYMEHENEIFTNIKPKDSITLVTLYPELKSDALVQKQLEVYAANNNKIKTLKEEKISAKIASWWLYFGD